MLTHTALAFCSLLWVRPDDALGHIGHGLEHAHEHGIDTMVGYLDAVRAWLLLKRGNEQRATRLAMATFNRAPSAAATVTSLVARTVLAERAVRQGEADADRTGEIEWVGPVLELQAERALTCGDPLPTGRLEQIAGIVGSEPLRRGGAGARIAAWAAVCGVLHAFEGMAPAPYAAMMRADWRAAAVAFGAVGWQHDRALLLSLTNCEDSLTEAIDTARALGARPLEHRIGCRMREAGMAVPRGPPSRAGRCRRRGPIRRSCRGGRPQPRPRPGLGSRGRETRVRAARHPCKPRWHPAPSFLRSCQAILGGPPGTPRRRHP